MKSRFEPDVPADATSDLSARLIDPEAYDASEQQFAASLELTPSSSRPRFVVEEEPFQSTRPVEPNPFPPPPETTGKETSGTASPQENPEVQPPPDPDAWRREVADRLNHYRARRRPREPRYPSLQLKFDTEPSSTPALTSERPSVPAMQREDYTEPAAMPRITLAEPITFPRILPAINTESTAKVIEFASYNPAPRSLDELAEPVLDRPRIMEAPELVPPPPALGGMLIEPEEEAASERRPGFEIPLQAAPMARRMAASAIDATLVLLAFAAFAYIFSRITAEPPPVGKIVGAGALLIGFFWSAYQYLLLVYSGATPGLKLARLELHRFDGSPVPLRIRRWRVLTSVLSGLSLGLGYAWCFLDEDHLCWHDRITRTYMAPAPPRTR
jgi:hypothetical protein